MSSVAPPVIDTVVPHSVPLEVVVQRTPSSAANAGAARHATHAHPTPSASAPRPEIRRFPGTVVARSYIIRKCLISNS